MLFYRIALYLFIFTIVGGHGPYAREHAKEKEFKDFLKNYESKVVPLEKEQNLAYFTAAVSGKDEDYKKSEQWQIQMTKVSANKNDFALLKRIKKSGKIIDPLLKRQLQVIYLAYLGNQVNEKKLEEMIKRQTAVEQKFSTYRAMVSGKAVTDNEINETLVKSKDSHELKNYWEASKQIGQVVAAEVIELIKLRNEVAKELGFNNYHTMALTLSEEDPQKIEKLFDELDRLTRDSFKKVKKELDTALASQYGIDRRQIRPWHYHDRFFQAAPQIYQVDFDAFYKNKKVIELAQNYYNGIGLSIDELITRSDLYEKEGKQQHAFCSAIDREGDVRVLVNIVPNLRWMDTTLHEFGHALYAKWHAGPALPWTLRDSAQIFTTEAVAQLFGRFATHTAWLRDMKIIDQKEGQRIGESSVKQLKLAELVFSRWSQVMYRFEKSMYHNPNQDLNALWWKLVEKYQLVAKPEGRNAPDWASKIHVATVPCYYHNYLMGELFASQLYHHIGAKILKEKDWQNLSWVGHPAVGEFLKSNVFMPGKKWEWNEMIKKATGEGLTPKYYAQQFVD